MRNYNKLPKAAMIKEIVKIIILGIILGCSSFALTFFIIMGSVFGYKDLNSEKYLETRSFADSVCEFLERISLEAGWCEEYVSNTKRELYIRDMTFDADQNLLIISSAKKVDLRTLAASTDYDYDYDEYGISNIVSENIILENDDAEYSEIQYDKRWYKIALATRTIENAESFCRISHDDYVGMFLSYAELNNGQDPNFASDCFIVYYEDNQVVYSPREDRFYSSVYGWYSVPNELFFLAMDVPQDGIDLYFQCFTSLNDILRLHIGGDYLEYIRAVKDISYNQRNVAYYVEHDGEVYTNVDAMYKVTRCNAYMIIQRTESGEYEVELKGFENPYIDGTYITSCMQRLDRLTPDDKLYVGIYTTYPYWDIFSEGNQLFSKCYSYTLPALFAGIVTAILAIVLLIHIFQTTGRISRQDKNIYLMPTDQIPIELLLLLGLAELVVLGIAIRQIYPFDYQMISGMTVRKCLILFGGVEGFCLLGSVWLLSAVRRVKAGCFWTRSLIRDGIRFGRSVATTVIRQKSLTAKAVEYFFLYWIVMGGDILLFVFGFGYYRKKLILISAVIFLICNIGVLILLIRKAKGEEAIREATCALAEGNMDYVSPDKKYLYTEQVIIDNMSHVNDGLHEAIEKSLYDERMKTELITNVSHDIKTPLTSIINYVDLIKREEVDNEKVQHYLEVLDKKSQRLKQLTEDLVEVSRISSGNIELERVPIDFGELLRQAMGEFEDKFSEHDLKMVEKIPENACMIYADGRRTFRILDNLLQNIYKYAMPGTRVYMDLTCEEEIITLVLKNISKAPLNIEVSELMERFVRGDQSRTTEGSGLGLSIAQDLVRMQDGEFQLYLDGDLFKVVIRFPEYISPVIIHAEAEGGLISENTRMPIPEMTDSQMEENS